METTYRKLPSGVVVNTNKSGYIQARKRKQKRLQDEQRIYTLEKEQKEIKTNINQILSLLQQEKREK